MENNTITDALFWEAVTALDAGDAEALKQLLADNPALAGKRLDQPDEGYFKQPYLLWFVADNPIRRGKLPSNIVIIATIIIDVVRRSDPGSLQFQIDYALELVATGQIGRAHV